MIRKNSWCVLDTWCVLGVAMMAFALCAVPAWADDADRAGEDFGASTISASLR
ncbi:MAG: hypothetical protein KJ042_10140 [Deltaproteobacteria bacterium]|nr:hypothetical protein [Deltaproteobacteria bacterium]